MRDTVSNDVDGWTNGHRPHDISQILALTLVTIAPYSVEQNQLWRFKKFFLKVGKWVSLILELLHRRSGTGETPWQSSVGIRFWPMYSMNHFPFQFFLERKVFHSKFFFERKVIHISLSAL